jgi:nicotinamide-nucleotide amidase
LIAERIEAWENNLPEFLKLAYLPSQEEFVCVFRLEDKRILENGYRRKNVSLIDLNMISLLVLKKRNIEVLERLNKTKKTLSTAESCTGGKIEY